MIIIVITRVEDWAVSQNVVNFLHPSSQSLVRNKVGLQFGQTLYIYLGLGKIAIKNNNVWKVQICVCQFFWSDSIQYDLTSKADFNSLV